MSVNKSCEVCPTEETLAPESYRNWGRALGRRLRAQAKFVVGGELRPDSPARLEALTAGLTDVGMQVVDVGLLPAPMIFYAHRRLRADGCAMVTANHDPDGQAGLRWMLGDELPGPEDIALLQREAEKPRRAARKKGARRSLDITFDYVAWLQETWVDSLTLHRRIVLDPRHGSLSAKARRYLQAVFPHCLFSAIHDTPEGQPRELSADGSRPESLRELCDAVYHQKADLGIAFDSRGERLAFVDEEGMPLSAEEAVCVFLESLGSEVIDAPFVYDHHFSRRVPEIAGTLKARPLAERNHQALLRRRMRETKAIFGAQTSGRYFFRALEGGDDGLFAACWLIAWLGHRGAPLSELRRRCPAVFITPELRVALTAPKHAAALKRVSQAWSGHSQSKLDGVRIEFPDGWALTRSCPAQQELAFRFEADNWPSLQQVVWRFCEVLDDLGDQVWMRYTAWTGSQE